MAIIHDGNSVPISSTNPLPSSLFGSEIQVPVDIQGRYATTIQTHSATMVPPTGTSAGAWFDCNGFDKVAITLKNDAVTGTIVDVDWSNDGLSQQGRDVVSILPTGSSIVRAGESTVKARYARFSLYNGDAAPHTMNVWAYLKA